MTLHKHLILNLLTMSRVGLSVDCTILTVGNGLAMYTMDIAEIHVQLLPITIRLSDSSSATICSKKKRCV